MGFKSMAIAILLLALSTSVNCAVLSYGGYTHDTTTNIVTGNGLEWLQWDVTVGESIQSIQSQLNTLEGGGWSVASNVQVAQLFNAFDFGITFDTDENTSQSVSTGYQYPDTLNETDELFIAMFGDTNAASGTQYCYTNGQCIKMSAAYFGADIDIDTSYNYALVLDDYQDTIGRTYNGAAGLYEDSVVNYQNTITVGLALVREVTVVPVPAAIWFFGSGLLGLLGVARANVRT